MESFSYARCGLAFFTTVVLLWALRPIAVHAGCVDHPGRRKVHSKAVPLVGGPAMAGGLLLGLAAWKTDPTYLAAGIALVLVGVWDDLFTISPARKLFAQFVVTIIAVTGGGMMPRKPFMGPNAILELDYWTLLFTVLATLVLINAINLVDGLDGLAGGLVLVALTSMAIVTALSGLGAELNMTLICAAPVVAFLGFNLPHPRQPQMRVFMGDSGSMLLGFTLAWLTTPLSGGAPVLGHATVLWFLAVPIFELTATILRRIIDGRSPLEADQKHLHHLLLQAGISTGQAVALLLSLAFGLAAFGLFGWYAEIPQGLMLLLYLLAFGIYFAAVLRALRLSPGDDSVRIIFLNRFFHPDISPTSRLMSDLAIELAKSGAQVKVISSRRRYERPSRPLASRETVRQVDAHRVWTSDLGRYGWFGRVSDYLTFLAGAFWSLMRLARRGDVVVALTDPPLLSAIAAPVCRLRGAHLVNWVQDVFPEVATALGIPMSSGGIGRLLRRLRDRTLQSARVNIALGERMRVFLLGRNLADEQVGVIHNWADGERLHPTPPKERHLRRHWGLDGRFVVGYSGNIGRTLDLETILDAAENLRGEEQFRFLIIGDGVKRSRLLREKARRKLYNLMWLPYQPRESLCQSLSAADLHLVSLRPELEGLVVPSKFYGIAAVGRPMIVVGDPQGEIGSLATSRGCGIAVRSGDGEGLACQIRFLSQNPRKLRRMGGRARTLFEDRFQSAISFDAWKAVLQSLGVPDLESSANEVHVKSRSVL